MAVRPSGNMKLTSEARAKSGIRQTATPSPHQAKRKRLTIPNMIMPRTFWNL